MKPALLRQTMPQGATWQCRMTWKRETAEGSGIYEVIDLSACTARMQVRLTHEDPVSFELSTQDGSIVLAADSPNISITATDANTRACVLPAGKVKADFVGDLEITYSNGVVSRVFDLIATVTREVTR